MNSHVKQALSALHLDGPARRLRGAVRNGLNELRQRGTPIWKSETSKCRERLARHCTGCGVDLGPGGDPIVPHAIRVDLAEPYSHVGDLPVQLSGWAEDLHWFKDGVLDFVYSSHLLEDYRDTERVLREWLRVLKSGGYLVLYCPDEQVYREHCAATGQDYNQQHIHANFSLEFVKRILDRICMTEVVYEMPLIDVYSWDLVCRKK
jgi:predicted SAM-dependent methyltransferase